MQAEISNHAEELLFISIFYTSGTQMKSALCYVVVIAAVELAFLNKELKRIIIQRTASWLRTKPHYEEETAVMESRILEAVGTDFDPQGQ
jgi:hypothetical protein